MGSGPNGCFTPRTYQHVNLGVAGIVLYPIALLWSFVGTQYIADEYFSVALDGIVELYHIDPDVAGATILAVGTSFPELICGFASQFLSSGGDSGAVAFGVTVGSAIFNQLVIVAACASRRRHKHVFAYDFYIHRCAREPGRRDAFELPRHFERHDHLVRDDHFGHVDAV
jgi:Ca2+/Na+ antiporter